MNRTEAMGSEALGNSGKYDIAELNKYGSTTAAHEFGHLLGYHVPKGIPTVQSPGSPEHDNDNHAWRSVGEEANFIMARVPGMDHSQNRVHADEFSRLGGGWERRKTENLELSEGMKKGWGGLYVPKNITNAPIVNPNNPITNQPY